MQKKWVCMKTNYRTRLLLEVRQPEPAKKPDWRNPYEEGKNLPGSVEEDVGVYALYPQYSPKQLRTIRKHRESIRDTVMSKHAKKWKKRESRQSHRAWKLRGSMD